MPKRRFEVIYVFIMLRVGCVYVACVAKYVCGAETRVLVRISASLAALLGMPLMQLISSTNLLLRQLIVLMNDTENVNVFSCLSLDCEASRGVIYKARMYCRIGTSWTSAYGY